MKDVTERSCRSEVLVLAPEAYGGFGGIATYDVDVVEALVRSDAIGCVHLVPRLVRSPPDKIPESVNFYADSAKSTGAFLRTALKFLYRQIDLVVCCHVNLVPIALVIAKLKNVPVVNVVYGTEVWKPTGRILVDRFLARCDLHLSISDTTTQRFLSWSDVSASQIRALPNAVHADKLTDRPFPDHLAARYGLTNRRVIMTMGRLDGRQRQKGIDELIRVLPSIQKLIPNAALMIAGDGDDRPRLAAIVASTGVQDDVVFTGRVLEEEKADHFRLADVFTLCGRQEGFGFVLIEALAVGTPVVGSVRDGSRDALLGGELGELADPDEPATIVEAILRALDKPRGVPDKLAHFSFERFQERLADALEPLLAPSPRGRS